MGPVEVVRMVDNYQLTNTESNDELGVGKRADYGKGPVGDEPVADVAGLQ